MAKIPAWIPCSERLPQHNKRVVVWHVDFDSTPLDDEGLGFLALRLFNTRTGEWVGLEKDEWPTHWLEGLEAP